MMLSSILFFLICISLNFDFHVGNNYVWLFQNDNNKDSEVEVQVFYRDRIIDTSSVIFNASNSLMLNIFTPHDVMLDRIKIINRQDKIDNFIGAVISLYKRGQNKYYFRSQIKHALRSYNFYVSQPAERNEYHQRGYYQPLDADLFYGSIAAIHGDRESDVGVLHAWLKCDLSGALHGYFYIEKYSKQSDKPKWTGLDHFELFC